MKTTPFLVEFNGQEEGCPSSCKGCNVGAFKTFEGNSYNKEALKSFNLLQDHLNKTNTKWGFTYLFNLKDKINEALPIIKNPELLQIMFFGYGKVDDINNNTSVFLNIIKDFQNKIDFLISNSNLNKIPQSLNFSVNKINLTPAVINLAKYTILHVLKQIESGVFQEGRVGIINNEAFVDNSFFDKKNKPNIQTLERDNLPLKFLKTLKPVEIGEGKNFMTLKKAHAFKKGINLYWNKNKSLSFSHRILFPKKRSSGADITKNEQISEQGIIAVSIHPKGIMFNHSGFEVHNKLLWVSHEEFRKKIKKNSKKTISELGAELVMENTLKK